MHSNLTNGDGEHLLTSLHSLSLSLSVSLSWVPSKLPDLAFAGGKKSRQLCEINQLFGVGKEHGRKQPP